MRNPLINGQSSGCDGKDASDVLVWRAKSREMNPDLSKAFVAATYVRDAALARAEFGAEFRNDIEGFISNDVIEACTARGRRELPPVDHKYCAFVDPAGGASDAMTLAVTHWDEPRKLAVLDMIRERQAPFDCIISSTIGLYELACSDCSNCEHRFGGDLHATSLSVSSRRRPYFASTRTQVRHAWSSGASRDENNGIPTCLNAEKR